MIKLSPRNKLFSLGLKTLVLWGLLAVSIYFFLIKDINRLNKEIYAAKIQYAQIDYNTRNFRTYKKDFDKASLDTNKVESVLLKEEKTIILVETLEALSEKYEVSQKIELQSTQQIKGEKKSSKDVKAEKTKNIIPRIGNLEVLTYNLVIEGKFINIINFIEALENLKNLTNITSIDLSSIERKSSEREIGLGADTTPENVVQVFIEAYIYIEKTPKEGEVSPPLEEAEPADENLPS